MKNYKRFLGIFTFLFLAFMCSNKVFAAPNIERIYGSDRYKTSIAISQKKWGKTNSVILASGNSFADSLCAAPLSKKLDAPIILVQDTLTEDVKKEIRRLGASKVYIVGGTGVIPTTTESQITGMGLQKERIAGRDRYATSIAVANKIGGNKLFVALGENFPDALSVGPVSGRDMIPIVLVQKNRIPTEVTNYLRGKSITKSYIVGGTGVISSNVMNGFPNSERIYGSDRYETNYKILQKFWGNSSMPTAYAASGKQFPDALSGAAAAAKQGLPIVLIGESINNNISNFLITKMGSNYRINVLGGSAVVPDNALNQKLTICIDAGHGGYDPGAIGPTGIKEKDVTLSVALKLGKILSQNGIRIVYTRTSDSVSWPSNVSDDLRKRVDIAKNAGADYFLSIHCNSFFRPSAYGTETYYSTSNNSGGISQKLAQAIQNELVKDLSSYNRGVKTANYYVNKYASCPSVLTELGFISNPNEEALLKTAEYQTKCAKAIADAILNFVKK
ncbi:cell wall-binding repeat-containing protein [Haloimpatiens sp. FM7330]|uniref:cell wall-binding repeat-containing protein n=1 Tax=Haloimpatiens sp. FM7330 TaxID=3298610 RepID=UPI003634F990